MIRLRKVNVLLFVSKKLDAKLLTILLLDLFAQKDLIGLFSLLLLVPLVVSLCFGIVLSLRVKFWNAINLL